MASDAALHSIRGTSRRGTTTSSQSAPALTVFILDIQAGTARAGTSAESVTSITTPFCIVTKPAIRQIADHHPVLVIILHLLLPTQWLVFKAHRKELSLLQP